MSFVVPLASIHKETPHIPQQITDAVRACIVGGHAHVESASAGHYLGVLSEPKFQFPHLPAGAVVDPTSVRVTLHTAVCYYKGTGFHAVKDYPDRVVGTINLRETAEHKRDKALKSRDVELGDLASINAGTCALNALVTGLAAPAISPEHAPETEEAAVNWASCVRTILLQRNLPQALREAKDLTVELRMPHKSIVLSQDKFIVSQDGVSLPQGLTVLSSQWFENGEPVPLLIDDATVEISYRAWLPEYADRVYEAADFDNVMKIAGPSHPDNPLRYGVELAFKSGGVPVEFIAVADPTDPESWQAAFVRIRKPYGIVPLTQDPKILDMAAAHVRSRSKAETGRECALWRTINAPQIAELGNCHAKINELPAGGFIAEEEGAAFVTAGIRAGDMATVNGVDCVVGSVLNEETLLLEGGAVPQGNVLLRVWRKRNVTERAHAIGVAAAALDDKRIRAVWPDQVSDGTRTIPGYYLCAALAGIRAGTAPQQDLTGVELAGITIPTTTVALFDEPQLDMMAELGVWVVTDADGTAVTRNAVTTADTQNRAESDESVVTNLDVINKVLRAHIAEIVHTARSANGVQTLLKSEAEGVLREFALHKIARLGPQLLESEVVSVRRHVVLADSVVFDLDLTLPLSAGCGPMLGKITVRQKLVV
jgi:hypothetical protein